MLILRKLGTFNVSKIEQHSQKCGLYLFVSMGFLIPLSINGIIPVFLQKNPANLENLIKIVVQDKKRQKKV